MGEWLEQCQQIQSFLIFNRFYVSSSNSNIETYLHALADARCVFDMAVSILFNCAFFWHKLSWQYTIWSMLFTVQNLNSRGCCSINDCHCITKYGHCKLMPYGSSIWLSTYIYQFNISKIESNLIQNIKNIVTMVACDVWFLLLCSEESDWNIFPGYDHWNCRTIQLILAFRFSLYWFCSNF